MKTSASVAPLGGEGRSEKREEGGEWKKKWRRGRHANSSFVAPTRLVGTFSFPPCAFPPPPPLASRPRKLAFHGENRIIVKFDVPCRAPFCRWQFCFRFAPPLETSRGKFYSSGSRPVPCVKLGLGSTNKLRGMNMLNAGTVKMVEMTDSWHFYQNFIHMKRYIFGDLNDSPQIKTRTFSNVL